MGKKFLAKARTSMERRGTVGSFTASAKKAGMGVQEFASHVLSEKSRASAAMRKKAAFAKAMKTIARRRA